MWIKICGLTSAEAVAAALALSVDAVGFVFAESVRRVSPAQARALAQPARGRARCVAVMRHPSQALLDEVLEGFGPDMLQADVEDLARLALPARLERLPVVRGGTAAALPARILFEGAVSGSGRVADWDAAALLARRTELVLAGGLNAGNVATAIGAVHPFGVDVSSGVEAAPGVKSPAAIADFVSQARAAARAVASHEVVQ
ncbi:MAG: phosphoribosylanthranilate isomerase [Proteobacteria bacterium]|nr:phosphoribosylanthranilate isomerase [Pseudomonadota bacterium]